MVSSPSPTTAFTIPSTPSPITMPLVDSDHVFNVACVLVSITAVIFIVHRCLRLADTCGWRINSLNRHLPACINANTLNQNISLYVRMNIDNQHHVMFITSVGFSPDAIFKTVPKCASYGLFVDYCVPRLVSEWEGSLVINCNGKDHVIMLPGCVSITWAKYQKIETVIRASDEIDPNVALLCQTATDAGFNIILPSEQATVPCDNDIHSMNTLPDMMSPLLSR